MTELTGLLNMASAVWANINRTVLMCEEKSSPKVSFKGRNTFSLSFGV